MNVNGFELSNQDKLDRVIWGNPTSEGTEGGLGEGANPEMILAHYDKLGGLITHNGIKIKTGSFWEFKRGGGAPRKKPAIMYMFNIGGDVVEVEDPTKLGEALSVVAKAREEKENIVKEKKAKSKFKDPVKTE